MAEAIRSVNLGKRYRGPNGSRPTEALKDVTFDVAVGEAVGLIGRNGAGKSTLLRILSRVTRPSSGYADVRGHVGALLEVGTGFHPDLTGRENVFLGGALIGMSKKDIHLRLDEIVAFSEIGPFLDMPVKRYSSGMFARLGFSVAAHLLPSILIVDEVLAVGDTSFQAKCLVRMRELASSGTTVLFVSHNLLALSDLCPRSLLLREGELLFDGTTADAIASYRRSLMRAVDRGSEDVVVAVDGVSSRPAFEVRSGDPLRIEATVLGAMAARRRGIIANVHIDGGDGRPIVHLRSDFAGAALEVGPGPAVVATEIESLPLAPGSYWLWVRLSSLDAGQPMIVDSSRIELQVTGDSTREALVLPQHRFRVSQVEVPAIAEPVDV